MIKYPHIKKANKYARDIISGKIDACLYVKQSCQRHIDDLVKSKKENYPYIFDKEAAEKICNFAEMLPHVKGKWSGTLMILEPWQCFILCVLFGWLRKSDGLRRFKEMYAEIPRKNGKAIDLGTEIPTPDGFKLICDIDIGDVVFGSDGEPCNVINESEIFTDHDCYEISFSTGEKVIADADHKWLTAARVNTTCGEKRTFKRRRPPRLYLTKRGYWAGGGFWHESRFTYKDKKRAIRIFKERAIIDLKTTPIGVDTIKRVRTTTELFKTQRYGNRNDVNHSIDICSPLNTQEKSFIVHPYILGSWLGDGSKDCAAITISYDDSSEVIGYLGGCGEIIKERKTLNENSGLFSLTSIRSWNGPKRDKLCTSRLKKIGVLKNKHIPIDYIMGSICQRTELLMGLMDTDGTICKHNGQCSFTNTNKQLANDVFTLVASLGLKPSMREKRAMLNGKDCGLCYDVSFMAHSDFPVFKLKRKLALQKAAPKIKSRSKTRQIVNVKKVDPIPVKCISVDSKDNLFLITRSFIPTHNSILGAIIGLYLFVIDGEPGAEVYSGATTLSQALEVFRPAWQMVDKTPGFRKRFNIELGGTEKNPGNIYSLSTASRFEAVIGKPGDGASVHCGLVDEYHEHKDDILFNCFDTGMGAREQGMIPILTTAGTNTSYPCYSKRKQMISILAGKKINEELFGIIYTIDEKKKSAKKDDPGDDWTDFKVWKKSNPNYGVSVFPDYLKRQHRSAIQETRRQNILKCKHLNLWSNAGSAWLNMVEWNAAADPDLDINQFLGDPCYPGLDLASKIDIASCMPLFKRDDHYYLFSRHYIPETRTHGEDMAHYAEWVENGYMTATPGSRIDFDYIKEDIIKIAKDFDLSGEENGGGEICNDPWNAQQLITELTNKNIACVEISQTVNMLSEPMKEIEAALKDGKFHHDGNPATEWMFSNTMCREDKKSNIFPFKEGDGNKIDGAVASITAMARAMYFKDKKETPVPIFI